MVATNSTGVESCLESLQRLVVLALCSGVSVRGSRTSTVAYRSPRSSWRRTAGIPWPLSRSTWPFCVAGGTFSRSVLAVERRHVGLAAQHGRRDRHRTRTWRSRPRRSKRGCGQQVHAQIEVARRGPAGAVFALAATRTREPSFTPAGIRTSTLRVWPSCLIAKRRVAPWNASSSVSSRSCSTSRPRLARDARPWRGRPALRFGRAAAEERVEEVRERVLVAEDPPHLVFGHRPEAALAAADVHRPRAVAEGARPALLLRLLVLAPVGAQFVVLAALVRVAEHLVGLVDLLEARLGGLVARVDVRVDLARELAVRLLDLLLGRGLRDAERGVVVLEFHRSPPALQPQHLRSGARVPAPGAAGAACRPSVASDIIGRMRRTTSATSRQALHAGEVDARRHRPGA